MPLDFEKANTMLTVFSSPNLLPIKKTSLLFMSGSEQIKGISYKTGV